MKPNYYAAEFKEFIDLQNEVRDTIQAGDLETAKVALAEIECIWLHADWPRMREATASFLRGHAEYAEYAEFYNDPHHLYPGSGR